MYVFPFMRRKQYDKMALLYDFTVAEDALLSELKMCQLLIKSGAFVRL